MSLNYLEIYKLLDELNLNDFFIQKIIQPSFNKLVFELYKPNQKETLVFSTEQNKIGFYFLTNKKNYPKNLKLQRFAQCLRSNIDGSKIVSAEQINSNRIILIKLKKYDINFNLYFRMWDSNCNIILTNKDNKIIDTMFRRPNKKEVSGELFKIDDTTNLKKDFSIREIDNEKKLYQLIESECEEEHISSIEDYRKKALAYQYKIEEDLKQSIIKIENQLKEFENLDLLKNEADILISDYGNKENIEKANDLYKSYKKGKKGIVILEESITNKKTLLLKTQDLIKEILDSQDEKFLKKFSDSLSKEKLKTDIEVGLVFYSNDFKILVGRNANENDILLRKYVNGNDYWLHVRDYHGGYIFIKSQKNKTIPLDVLLDASNLAVWFSKAKNATSADLYYTQVKYLRRAKDGRKGLVIPTNEKNLFIKVDKDKLDSLLKN